MLESEQPFKTVLKVLNYFGLWKINTLKSSHRNAALIAFLLFKKLAFLFAILSFLLHDKKVIDYVRSLSMICSHLMNSGYIHTFWLCSDKIQELFDDFNHMCIHLPKSFSFVKVECVRATKIEKRKFIGMTIWITFAIAVTFINGDISIPIYLPEFMTANFYLLWLYQSIHIAYLAAIVTTLLSFFFSTLIVINGFVVYLQMELKALDLEVDDAKVKLIECVRIHQDIRRLMAKYKKITSYAVALQMLLGGYILCTAAYIAADENNGEIGSFLGIVIITSMQLFNPCLIAQEIESASSNFMNDVIESNWLNANVKTKMLLLIFMQNLSKPLIKFNLFSIVDVNLNTFLRIINTAYSAYAVLNTMRN